MFDEFFDALHVEHRPLRAPEAIAAFVGELGIDGIDEARFLETMRSFAVQTRIRAAMAKARGRDHRRTGDHRRRPLPQERTHRRLERGRHRHHRKAERAVAVGLSTPSEAAIGGGLGVGADAVRVRLVSPFASSRRPRSER